MCPRYNITHEEIVDGLVYRIAKTPEDVDKVIDLYFDVMMDDEPIARSKGGYRGFRHPSWEARIRGCIKQGLTIICLEPDTELLVGMQIATILERPEGLQMKKEPLPELLKHYPEMRAVLMSFIDDLAWPPTIFKQHEDLQRLFCFNALGTLREYRGRGIGMKLSAQALKVGIELGCDAAVVVASHLGSRRIFEKLGMSQIGSFDWKDSVYKGKVYFDNVECDTTAHFMRMSCNEL